MKKFIFGIIAGMILHKALNYVYDISFEKAFISNVCAQTYMTALDDKNEPAPLSKRFECTYKEMGMVENLKYVLARPSARITIKKDFWIF